MALPFSYNVRNAFQRPVSTATTAVGIALTVAIFIGALALASGFQRSLRLSGDPRNVVVVRKGADSEMSSGVTRDASNIIAALPDVAAGPDGHPLSSPEVFVVSNKPRLGQPGNSNLTVRGVDPSAFALRGDVKIVEGRMFAPGTAEIIVGEKVAPRFAGCQRRREGALRPARLLRGRALQRRRRVVRVRDLGRQRGADAGIPR